MHPYVKLYFEQLYVSVFSLLKLLHFKTQSSVGSEQFIIKPTFIALHILHSIFTNNSSFNPMTDLPGKCFPMLCLFISETVKTNDLTTVTQSLNLSDVKF